MYQDTSLEIPAAFFAQLVRQPSDEERPAGHTSGDIRARCGAWLSNARIRKGLSMAQAAEQVGVAANTILLLERGFADRDLADLQISALALLLSDDHIAPDVIGAVIQTALGRSELQIDRLLADALHTPPEVAERIGGDPRVDSEDKLALLRSVPLFARLNDAALEALALQLTVEQFAPGDIIFKQNSIGKTMYIVVSGEVSIYMTSPRGKDLMVKKLKAGGFFGEMALLDGQVRSASVQVEQPTMTLTLHSREFWSVVMPDPTMSVVIILELSRRLRELLHYSMYLTEMVSSDKVAETLAEFVRRRNTSSRDVQIGQWEVMSLLSQHDPDVPSTDRAALMELLQMFQSAVTG